MQKNKLKEAALHSIEKFTHFFESHTKHLKEINIRRKAKATVTVNM